MTTARIGIALALTLFVSAVQAQDTERKDASTEQTTQFAPGVVTVIPPDPNPEETFDGPLTLKSFLDAHPGAVSGKTPRPSPTGHRTSIHRSRTLVRDGAESRSC